MWWWTLTSGWFCISGFCSYFLLVLPLFLKRQPHKCLHRFNRGEVSWGKVKICQCFHCSCESYARTAILQMTPLIWLARVHVEKYSIWYTFPHPALFSFCPQLLTRQSLNKAPEHSRLEPYFQDGQRRVDYILTYHVEKLHHTRHHSSSTLKSLKDSLSSIGKHNRANSTHHDPERASNAHIHREEFEQKLMDMGLQLEKDEDVSIHVIFCLRYFSLNLELPLFHMMMLW